MYHDGICGDLWILLRNMYREVSVKVKWDNNLSKKVDVALGIRQRAKLSTMLYKRYNNNILEALERSGMGAQIGNLRVVPPTCPDDIAILACSKHEAQALLEIALILTDKDLVRINPTKTDLVPLTRKATNFELNMGDNSIEQTNETKHLGLMRNSDNKIKVDERIRVGRKTIYALLGPGLHARQGTCPTISYKIWKTYVIPRILYGVEVLNHTLTDIKKLERLQVQICKQIHGLPERTANLAAYCLLGVKLIELVVDRLTLTFLGNILQDKTTIEFQIVERQHAMMKTNTQNYANVITNIPRKYRLPELYNILQDIPTNWKQEIKDKIQEYWEKQWIEEAKKRTSLKFLAIPKMGKTHYVWKTVPNDCIEVKKGRSEGQIINRNIHVTKQKKRNSAIIKKLTSVNFVILKLRIYNIF